MTDRLSREARSKLMSRVRNRNTSPELAVRSVLHSLGYRFRLHRRDLPGTPDIVLPKHRLAVFVHGCFWHGHPGCPRAKRPSDNESFWRAKIQANMVRDDGSVARLRYMGWRVLVIWECETRDMNVLRALLTVKVPEPPGEAPAEPP